MAGGPGPDREGEKVMTSDVPSTVAELTADAVESELRLR